MSNARVQGTLYRSQWDAVAIAAVVLLVFSFAFGGASRDNALRLALVELAALPLLVTGAGRLIQTGLWRKHRLALGVLGAIVLVPLIHLIPLPPFLWTGLPGREQMVLALDLAGLQPGWVPLSTTPELTWRSVLALIPPAAMFIGVLSAPGTLHTRLVGLFLGLSAAGLLWGAAQILSGGEALYPWATTSAGSMNGPFANRNHLAGLLLATLPFAAVLGAAALRHGDTGRLRLWIAALFMGVVVVALAAIRSRAGVILFIPVTMFSLGAAWIAAGRDRPAPALLALVGGVGAALTAVAVLALPPILERFDKEAPDGRFDRWPTVAEAAQTYLPVGSGIGSFDAVYRSVEPLAQLDSTYFNQAHNEYLETWLEAGWLGVGVILAFLIWFGRRVWSAWRAGSSPERDLQRAASIAIGVVLVHSIAEYPLRMTAMTVMFALWCGLLEQAGRPDQSTARRKRTD